MRPRDIARVIGEDFALAGAKRGARAPLLPGEAPRSPLVAHRVLPPFPFPEIFDEPATGTLTLRKCRLRAAPAANRLSYFVRGLC